MARLIDQHHLYVNRIGSCIQHGKDTINMIIDAKHNVNTVRIKYNKTPRAKKRMRNFIIKNLIGRCIIMVIPKAFTCERCHE